MLRKRIIFSLIYCDGYFSQSRNFRLQRVGDLIWLNKNYNFRNIASSIDELIVLNASREQKNIKEFSSIINKLVNEVFIPIASGGGIKNIEDAELLFKNGSDKIVLNTLLIENPNMVNSMVKQFGSQSILASIDCKFNGNDYDIFIEDGKVKIDFQLEKYIRYLEDLGVGELYLNSIDKDGTGFGYDSSLISKINYLTKIPLIIAGGAGNENHLSAGLKIDNVNAVATANLFNFIGDGLPNARKKIIDSGLNIANWNVID